jgi:hypothetical protein
MITQMNVMSLLQHFSIQVSSLKRNACPPSHLDGCTIAKNAREFFYSGCGGTLVNISFVKKYKKMTLTKSTNWTTKAGTFKTDRKVKCQFTLPEFHEGKDISWNMHVCQ